MALAKEIALTFDDAPRPSTALTGKKRSELLVKSLKGLKVAFFANSDKLTEEGKERMKFYGNAGHSIGNHTHSHPEINKTPIQDYLTDIRKADDQLKGFPNFMKWFRFPYLREGETVEKRDKAREELNRLGYINGYVTVKNYDWYMDWLYQQALKSKKKIDRKALRDFYVQTLMDGVKYYDQMAMDVLGRSPKHILLLHENDLAALFVKDLILELQKQGWKIIDPALAYKDDIASFKATEAFPSNPGRIGEIAKDKKWKGKLWHEACDEEYLDKLFTKNVLK